MKKVALIGFGFIGYVHAQNILKNKKLELSAIIDTDTNAVSKKVDHPDGNFFTGGMDVEAIKKVKVYISLEECLASEEIDAVHICVHTNLHYSMAKEALNNGLHVMLEKPFVLDVDKGEDLIKQAKNNKLVLMIAHVVRFMSPYKKLTEFILSKTYGELKFLSLSRFSGIPNWGQWLEKQKDFGSSGGALFDLLIHDIDYARFVLGEPEHIQSKVLPGKLSKYDYMNAYWQYPAKNISVKIEGGNIFHSEFPFHAGYTAVFDRATVSFSSNDARFIHIDNNTSRTSIDADDLGDGYFNEIELFAQSIHSGVLEEQYSPESALKTIKLCQRHIANS